MFENYDIYTLSLHIFVYMMKCYLYRLKTNVYIYILVEKRDERDRFRRRYRIVLGRANQMHNNDILYMHLYASHASRAQVATSLVYDSHTHIEPETRNYVSIAHKWVHANFERAPDLAKILFNLTACSCIFLRFGWPHSDL